MQGSRLTRLKLVTYLKRKQKTEDDFLQDPDADQEIPGYITILYPSTQPSPETLRSQSLGDKSWNILPDVDELRPLAEQVQDLVATTSQDTKCACKTS